MIHLLFLLLTIELKPQYAEGQAQVVNLRYYGEPHTIIWKPLLCVRACPENALPTHVLVLIKNGDTFVKCAKIECHTSGCENEDPHLFIHPYLRRRRQ